MSAAEFTASPDCTICGMISSLVRNGTNPLPSRNPKTMFQPAARLGTLREYTESANKCPLCQSLLSRLGSHQNPNEGDPQPQPPEDDAVVEMAYLLFMGVWEIMVERLPTWDRPNSGTTLADLKLIRHVIPEGNSVGTCQEEGTTNQKDKTYQKNEMLAFVETRSEHGQDEVDFSRIKNWISYCDMNHQGTCFEIQDPWKRMDSPETLYFVDVDEECISLQLATTSVYVTLSYVWGNTPSPLMLTSANIDNLCTPHSLSEKLPLGKQLPQTIRDAMQVTKTLGYRYLWVDRLCIIQDDQVQKPKNITAMAGIYSNASMTIIADNGDDAQGLPGISSTTSTSRRHCRRRRRPFNILYFPEDIQLVLDDSNLPIAATTTTGESEAKTKTYNSRGWTLQEELLSNRTLRFTSREIRFLCRKSRFRELLHDSRQVVDNRKSSIEIQLFKRNPDISTYGHLLGDYLSRQLTFDSDAVKAFTAIMAAYSRSMRGGILFGIPELFWEGCLLWRSSEPLRRRRGSADVSVSEAGEGAPSWSPLGWQGDGLCLQPWDVLYTNTGRDKFRRDVYFTSVVKILPCVEFYKTTTMTMTTDTQTGQQRRELIQSSYHAEENISDKKEDYHVHKVPIPEQPFPSHLDLVGGWSSILTVRTQLCKILVGDGFVTDDQRNDPGQCRDVFLVDDDVDDEDNHTNNGDDRGNNGHGADDDNDTNDNDNRNSGSTDGKRGRVIGTLRPDTTTPTKTRTHLFGTRISLIIISRGMTTQRPHSWEFPELAVFHAKCGPRCFASTCKADKQFLFPYEFYNVLWVTWGGENGIAYRQGIGRVLKSAWDNKRGLEEVEVRLG